MNQVEIVKCKCGSVIAACVMGYQDATWDKNRRQYIAKGYEVAAVQANEFVLAKCVCEKPHQLLIFDK